MAGNSSSAADVNGSATLLCVFLLILASSVDAYSASLGLVKRSDQLEVCSRNMPCGWALCEWIGDQNNSEERCSVIKNTSCRCYNGHLCSIDLNSLEPSSYDRSYIKYEYLCRKQSRIMNYLMSK